MKTTTGLTSALLSALMFFVPVHEVAAGDFFTDPPRIDDTHPPGMVELIIPSHGSRMNGMIYTANGRGPHPTVILLHGLPGNEKNLDLAQVLRRDGWNVIFFHYRGAWGSEGHYSLANVLQDTAVVIDYAANPDTGDKLRVDPSQLILLGHSTGGFAAILSAEHPAVTCTVGLAPWEATATLSSEQSRRDIGNYVDSLVALRGFSGAKIIDELTRNKDRWSLSRALARTQTPTLIVTGALDTLPVPGTTPKTNGRVTSKRIEQADHSFSARRIEVFNTVVPWLNRNCRRARP